MAVKFTQKWIEQAVQKLLSKEEIEVSDLARIKYLSIGESFDNDFFIETSLEVPPKPFVDTDGGDEWTFCLRGGDISQLIECYKNGETPLQLSMFGLESEDEKWEEYANSDKAEKLWNGFLQSVSNEHYYEQHEDEEFDAWYGDVSRGIVSDVPLFTGVEVLRIKGLEFADLEFLAVFPNLRTAEFVETVFRSTKGIERLNGLEQLSCWMD